jgi:hypothetical protein
LLAAVTLQTNEREEVVRLAGFYRVFFRDMEIGELNVEELRFRAARRVV